MDEVKTLRDKAKVLETYDQRVKQSLTTRSRTQDSNGLGKCERAVLSVLAQYRNGCRSGKLALLAGYSYSGGFRNALSALRTAGFMEGENTEIMRATPAGIQALGSYDPLPRGRALIDYWLQHPSLGKVDRAALSVLVKHYPKALTGKEIAEFSGYEYSGGFRNALSKLRTAGLILGKSNTSPMSATDDLFTR